VGNVHRAKKVCLFLIPTANLIHKVHTGTMNDPVRLYAIMQCSGCENIILAIAERKGRDLSYVTHYPIGKPNEDRAAAEIPPNIRSDFQEAIRCRSVDAYKATVSLCRRALEASCNQLGAKGKGKSLEDKINGLAELPDRIKALAHKVRLKGNKGAHPQDGLDTVGEKEADTILRVHRNVHAIRVRHRKED